MKLKLWLGLLAAAGMAAAGEMLTPVCEECGWTGTEIFYGQGPDDLEPLGLVYMSPHGYAEVAFDIPCILSAGHGFEVPPRGSRWMLADSFPGIYELIRAWQAPEEVATDDQGPWIVISGLPEKDLGRRAFLRLVERPLEGLYPCPSCGRIAVGFEVTGEWD